MATKTKDQKQIEELEARVSQLTGIIDEMEEAYEQKLNEANSTAIIVVRESVTLIDPAGRGHVPSGSNGVYQDVLDKLNGYLAVVEAPEEDSETAEQEEG